MLTKQETLLGRDAQAESSSIGEPGGTTLPMRLAALSFMVIGLISRLSLANHADSWSLHSDCVPVSAKVNSSEKDSGKLVGYMNCSLLSPFDLSQILLVGGS